MNGIKTKNPSTTTIISKTNIFNNNSYSHYEYSSPNSRKIAISRNGNRGTRSFLPLPPNFSRNTFSCSSATVLLRTMTFS